MVIPKKQKFYKIFTCPECRYRKFTSLRALNIHYTKQHSEKRKKFGLTKKNQGFAKITGKARLQKQKLIFNILPIQA